MDINNVLKDFFTQYDRNPDKIKSFQDIIREMSFADRELVLGSVTAEAALEIETMISFWNKVDAINNIDIDKRQPIKIYIDSEGGDLSATFTIIDAIQLSKTPVYTINIGCAYSGGFFSFLAGHKRIAYPHSSFLYHEGSIGYSSDAHKFRNMTEFYNKQLSQLKDHVLSKTKISAEDYEKIIKDDYWLTAKEALEKGVCDMIATEMF